MSVRLRGGGGLRCRKERREAYGRNEDLNILCGGGITLNVLGMEFKKTELRLELLPKFVVIYDKRP
jgi:hypothetical protein